MCLEFGLLSIRKRPANNGAILGRGKDVLTLGIKPAIDEGRPVRVFPGDVNLFGIGLHGAPRLRQDFLDGLKSRIGYGNFLPTNLEASAAVHAQRL